MSIVAEDKQNNLTSLEEKIQQALLSFNVCNPQQGISGSIAFGPDGDPIDKTIVILFVNDQSLTSYLQLAQGKLLAAKPQSCPTTS